ncbi:MAG: class I SAM-dependent methyltransferase [Peptococcaceae bacterium]|nr:class I SAM-dependent methyltransferase [Peptococcaceae bacterium]
MQEASILNNDRILDLGCGTGTLAILIKQACSSSEVIGIDADQKILEIAKEKIRNAGLNITLDHGAAPNLPYADESFDLVVSSLVFHHLTRTNKIFTLKEINRILRPNGHLLLADFGKPENFPMYLVSLVMRNFEETTDNYKGLLPKMIHEAGFDQVKEVLQYSTLFGTLCLYKGCKP